MTATTPIRARLRAARDRRRGDTREWGDPAASAAEDRRIMADFAALHRPYRYAWARSDDGLWTLVMRVNATGQILRCGYAVRECPGDLAGERIAARLYALRMRENPRTNAENEA